MLKNFTIKNYKSIKELEIKDLNRVNLLVGRNNAGKSNVLEALLLFATNMAPMSVYKILLLRKDINTIERSIDGRMRIPSVPENLLPLVTNRSIENLRIPGVEFKGNDVTIGLRSFIQKRNEDDGSVYYKFVPFTESEITEGDEDEVSETVRVVYLRNKTTIINSLPLRMQRSADDDTINTSCIYVNCSSRDSENVESLWNKIVLSPLKLEIVRALQLISPNIEDIAVIRETGRREALPYVRMNGATIPLHSMGDGMAHIFNIMLALVNVKDGILLLDEMENGLHVRTLEQLWTIINELSKQLNVQVFVTTHSNDCIRAFKENAQEEGRLFCIKRVKEQTLYKSYDFKTIQAKLADNIDLRDYTNAEICEDEDL